MLPFEQPSLISQLRNGPLRLCVLGCGNWGTAVSTIVARNAQDCYLLNSEVTLWVFEETLSDGRLLSEVINTDHENPKYLPGIKLPENITAEPDIAKAVSTADLLVFTLPHQFIVNTCTRIKPYVKSLARAVTLVKGLYVEDGMPRTSSDIIERILGVQTCALSGANVANDVANKQFCESTLGYQETDLACIWQQVFERPEFRVNCVPDLHGVQVCGALKNVVAVASGFCDGLGFGTNTKAAIIRLGVSEMKLFASIFFPDVLEETFLESSGIADIITTCFGGRNVRCAAEFVRRGQKDSWTSIEQEMLDGQRLQGPMTVQEVYEVLDATGLTAYFPLTVGTYQVSYGGQSAREMLKTFFESGVQSGIKPLHACNPVVLPPEMMKLQSKILARKEGHTTPKHGVVMTTPATREPAIEAASH